MIVPGARKRELMFYLAREPQSNLISTKKRLNDTYNLVRDLNYLIGFLPLLPKEKSLYNIASHENNNGGVT